jgi:hypothetical protein
VKCKKQNNLKIDVGKGKGKGKGDWHLFKIFPK